MKQSVNKQTAKAKTTTYYRLFQINFGHLM